MFIYLILNLRAQIYFLTKNYKIFLVYGDKSMSHAFPVPKI